MNIFYDVRRYIKEYEDAAGIKIIKEKAGISQNHQLMKILQIKFPVNIVGNIALVDVSGSGA